MVCSTKKCLKSTILVRIMIVLEFVFDKDPNLYLRKHKIAIKGYIEVEDDFVVENGWVSKLFANVNVELDSQSVSVIRNKYDSPKNQKTNFQV